MPTIEENRKTWSTYKWPEEGDEWSVEWGGTPYLWCGTIFPRIRAFLPADSILEIAPGYGRCTQYLLSLCSELTVVDLSERCIKACQERFKSCSHIKYFVNDGKSLDMISDNSIDFVFSWDSLVHAETDVLHSYLHYLWAKLKPTGYGFFHHSNIGAFTNPETGKLTVDNRHWRATSMTAGIFRGYCDEVGLECISQEIIGWGGDVLGDCFSLFRKEAPGKYHETVISENREFMNEAFRLRKIAQLFHPPRMSNRITQGENTSVSKAKEICFVSKRLASSDREVTRVRGGFTKGDHQVAPGQGEMAPLNAEIARLAKELARRDAALAAVRDSLSWKIATSPEWLVSRAYGALALARKARRAGVAGTVSRVLRRIRTRIMLAQQVCLVDGSGLFDHNHYLANNPEAANAGVDPVVHYLTVGALEGRDPHPLFDTSYYLSHNPDVARAGINPLVHYLRFGAYEGRDPHAHFDSSFYLEKNPDVAEAGINPLTHYVGPGIAEGRDPSPDFDTSAYLEANPDVARKGLNPLVHHLESQR